MTDISNQQELCFCQREFGAEFERYGCIGKTVGDRRPPGHREGSWSGGSVENNIETIKALMETEQVTSIKVERFSIDLGAGFSGWGFDIKFETCDNVCASQLGHYLVFRD